MTAGCYTQLRTSYVEKQPDHQTVTEYETEYGDSVVVDNYYYEDYTSHYRPRYNRYRRHFSTFYGHPYAVDPFYDPYYDPFYDDYWYGGSRIHLSFGWGTPYLYSPYSYGWHHPYAFHASPYYYGGGWGSPWGHRYYGTPLIYHTGFVDNYGPRSARIGRRGVRARGGRYLATEDNLSVNRRGVVNHRAQRTSELARSRTRSGVVSTNSRTRGIQRQADDDLNTRTRRGVTRTVPGERARGATSTRSQNARSGNTRRGINSRSTTRTRSGSATRTRSTQRTRSSSGSRTRSAPQTRSTQRTRSSSGSRTRSAPQTRSTQRTRSSSGSRTRSAPQTRSTPRTRSSSGSRTRSAPQTRSSSGSSSRSTPKTRSTSRKRGSSLSDSQTHSTRHHIDNRRSYSGDSYPDSRLSDAPSRRLNRH
ncbi:MAG: hypothetical protein OXF84_01885 [Bacteroidetes bacterium]|nr:hypothetical protein [Bacteroidota bacterium]